MMLSIIIIIIIKNRLSNINLLRNSLLEFSLDDVLIRNPPIPPSVLKFLSNEVRKHCHVDEQNPYS